jgi:hypothetical protein
MNLLSLLLNMSKNSLWVVILLLVLGIGGYMVWANSSAKMVSPETGTEMTPAGVVTPTATGTTPVPTVAPKTIVMEQTGVSGQSGSAVFQGEGANTKVTLSMIGKKFTAPQPAHIHVGKCPTPGAVKYPLNNVVDGKSETVISVSIEDLFADLPLAVNVHESAEKASVYTACGDLK